MCAVIPLAGRIWYGYVDMRFPLFHERKSCDEPWQSVAACIQVYVYCGR